MAITVSTPTIEKLSETSIRVTYANSDGATNWRFIVSNGTNDTRQTDITTDTVFTFIELSAGSWYAVVVAYTVATGDNALPQIKQNGISELFGQSKNSNPTRFLFWDGSKASSQTANLSISFYGPNGLYEKLLKNKLTVLNNTKPFKRKVLLTLPELMAFSFRKKIYADGIWYLAEQLSVKLRKNQEIYEVEFILRRIFI